MANPAEIAQIKTDEETQDVKKLLGLADLDNPYIVCLAYCGAVMLLAGKQLSEVSAPKWTERRLVGLAASMGVTISPAQIVKFDVATALKVYQKVSALYMVRSTLVRIILGTVGQNSLAGNLAGAMHNLLAWAEMNHIRLVHEFLFGRYPELLTMRQLQGSTLGVLSDAWEYLGTLEKAERPFAKLLYSPSQTKALQRDRFVLLTDAAHAVGNHIYSSFTNYQGDTAGSLGRSIKMAVSEYLTSLDAIGTTTVKATHIAVTHPKLLESFKRVDEIFSSQTDRVDEDIDEMVRS